jgi:D-glycero-alpha-D-manno-heptose-7-phosphate kinase
VIITRTPLRISLGGGGTDLPSGYQRNGGFVVAAAINKYIYVGIHDTFVQDYLIKYSELERVRDVSSIRHPVVREALMMHAVAPAIEIISLADIPAGTGLGSSGAFTVGLLRALYAHKHEHVLAGMLAEEACHIEIDRLSRPSGKQDQYVAAYGGLICMDIATDGRVSVSPLAIDKATLHDLEEHLLLFFTGYSRDADVMLASQQALTNQGDADMLHNLRETARIGREVKASLESGDTERFAGLLHEHWELKRRRTPGMSNASIDRWYDTGRSGGALGGKLVGAGAGGFLLFYANSPARLRKTMGTEGLAEVRFQFDFDGSSVIVRD